MCSHFRGHLSQSHSWNIINRLRIPKVTSYQTELGFFWRAVRRGGGGGEQNLPSCSLPFSVNAAQYFFDVSSPKLQSCFWLLFFSLTVSKAVPSKHSQKQIFSHCLLRPHSDLSQYHHLIPIRAPAAATVILCTVDQMVSLVPALFSWWCQPCRIWSLSASSPPLSPLAVPSSLGSARMLFSQVPGDCLLTTWEMPPLTVLWCSSRLLSQMYSLAPALFFLVAPVPLGI